MPNRNIQQQHRQEQEENHNQLRRSSRLRANATNREQGRNIPRLAPAQQSSLSTLVHQQAERPGGLVQRRNLGFGSESLPAHFAFILEERLSSQWEEDEDFQQDDDDYDEIYNDFDTDDAEFVFENRRDYAAELEFHRENLDSNEDIGDVEEDDEITHIRIDTRSPFLTISTSDGQRFPQIILNQTTQRRQRPLPPPYNFRPSTSNNSNLRNTTISASSSTSTSLLPIAARRRRFRSLANNPLRMNGTIHQQQNNQRSSAIFDGTPDEFMERSRRRFINSFEILNDRRTANSGLPLFADSIAQLLFEVLLSAGMQQPHTQGQPPASDEAKASLRRILSFSKTLLLKCPKCLICQEDFQTGSEEVKEKVVYHAHAARNVHTHSNSSLPHSQQALICEMPCKHVFHQDCLFQWLNQSNQCPTCRYEIMTDNQDYNVLVSQRMAPRNEILRKEEERECLDVGGGGEIADKGKEKEDSIVGKKRRREDEAHTDDTMRYSLRNTNKRSRRSSAK